VFTAADYLFEMTQACAYYYGGNNFCGIWHQPCGVFGDGTFDMIKLLTVQGDVDSVCHSHPSSCVSTEHYWM
jgi:hypothetical protein